MKPLSLVCLLLCGVCATPASAARFAADGDRLTLSTPAYQARLDLAESSLRLTDLRAGAESIATAAPLWAVELQGGARLAATDCTCRHKWLASAGRLELVYAAKSGPFRLKLTITPGAEGLDVVAAVEATDKTVLTLRVPGRVVFDSDRVTRFHFPSDLGIAFKRAWFQPGTADRPTGWRTHGRGSEGLAKLVGVPCDMGDDRPKPVPVAATETGRAWLGEGLSRDLAREKYIVNRTPEGGVCDAALVTSADGVFVPGYQLGGKGWLLRFGGRSVDRAERSERTAARVVARSLDAAWARSDLRAGEARPTKIGFIHVPAGRARGGWAVAAVSQLEAALRQTELVRRGTMELVTLTTPGRVTAALADPAFFAIVNPYGEGLPVEREGQLDAFMAAIRGFVVKGGVWWEVGGYSFYYELVPERYTSFGGTYPALFSDFVHLDSKAGRLSVFGIQPEDSLFVPGTLRVGSSAEGGWCEHAFNTFVAPGKTWTSPAVRLAVGRALTDSLAEYGRESGFTRTLADKVKPETLAVLKQCVLVKYTGGDLRQKTGGLDRLPKPTLVHIADYLKGGFDKQYPDHLPPHPSQGTPADLRRFYDRCHELGHLVMPYTNPTWWCIEPKGPTFVKHGDAPLSRRLDGKLYAEAYGSRPARGFALCTWHPAAREAQRVIRRQFTRDYPSDLLFQDQVGARRWRYDTNPAGPAPYAYTQGQIEIAKEDSRFVPLSTENGFDRLINYETQFCGITWKLVPMRHGPSWRRLYREMFAPGTWELSPMALFLAHDKCVFTHHDLGQFILRDETLAWSLAIGYQMIYTTSAGQLADAPNRQWLEWLAAVQRTIASRYMGRRLTEFKYLTPTVLFADYDGTRVWANTGAEPYVLDKRTTLAPFGFYATAGKARAGVLTRFEGREYKDGLRFCADGDRVSIYGPAGQQVGWAGKTLTVRPTGEVEATVPVPADRQAAPARWSPAPAKVGLIALEPKGAPYGWTDIKADEWARRLGASPLFSGKSVVLTRLRTADEVLGACRAGSGEWLAIVNPYGETFPARSADDWKATLEAVRRYVRHGGIWWEVAGWPFYCAVWAQREGGQVTGWGKTRVGAAGWASLGQECVNLAVDQPRAALRVTDEGATWLGDKLAKTIGGRLARVNRPTRASGNEFALVTSADGDYISGHHLGGWGVLFRACGGGPEADVLAPIVARTLEHAYRTARTVHAPRTQTRWLNTFTAGP